MRTQETVVVAFATSQAMTCSIEGHTRNKYDIDIIIVYVNGSPTGSRIWKAPSAKSSCEV